MNRKEAKLALFNGKKLTHTNFITGNQWVTGKGNRYVYEDGVIMLPKDFWGSRKDSSWDEGWSFVK